MENSTAKNFALQLGSLITLYITIGGLIQLLFGLITLWYPDALNMPWEGESAQSSIRISIALLVVFFPTYIALTRTINVDRRATGGAYLSLTKWLIYLSILVGSLVVLGDLVALIYNFLNGELTTRFLLKALVVLVVVGAACAYYIYDAKEYWHTHEKQSKQYGLGVALLVLVSVVAGFMYIESPAQVREKTADQKQINDLVMIQSFIIDNFTIKGSLPLSLNELELKASVPAAPEGRPAYTYTKIDESNFKLCATFVTASTPTSYTPYYDPSQFIKNADNWNHEAGPWCFTRVMNTVVDPNANTTKIEPIP